MESVPEPRPSEWDKRLSTHSPFRTLNVNGQIPTGADGVSTLRPRGGRLAACPNVLHPGTASRAQVEPQLPGALVLSEVTFNMPNGL